jgi:hypothetical protein
MGMFDWLFIDKAHLPEQIRTDRNQEGWQTKSLDCRLDLIEIDQEGQLYITPAFWYTHEPDHPQQTSRLDYTGDIVFYNDLKDGLADYYTESGWWEFVASFKDGKLQKLTQIEANERDRE